MLFNCCSHCSASPTVARRSFTKEGSAAPESAPMLKACENLSAGEEKEVSAKIASYCCGLTIKYPEPTRAARACVSE